MADNPGILTTLLNAFLAVFAAGPGHLAPAANRLLFLVGGIELTLAGLWWALKGDNILVVIIKKTMLLGLFLFFVTNWPTLINSVLDGFVWTGFTAAGSSPAAGAVLIKDPSAIISQAFVSTQPIADKIHSLSAWDLGSLCLYGWSYIATIIAFFMLAIQVFVTYLEFYLVSALSLILVPFGVFRHTAFLAERAFGSVISFGVKLMVLAFILAAVQPILVQITTPPEPTFQQAYMVLLAALAIAFLAWHAPGIAAGMISGGPSLTAGSVAGFGASSIFAALGGAASAAGATRAIGRGTLVATQAAAEGVGTLTTGARLGRATAQLGGSGPGGQTVGAVGGSVRAAAGSIAEYATRPIRAAAPSVSEAHKRGTLRAWKPEAPSKTPGGRPSTSSQDIRDAVRTAQTVRSVIPPESHGGSGIHAPIKPE